MANALLHTWLRNISLWTNSIAHCANTELGALKMQLWRSWKWMVQLASLSMMMFRPMPGHKNGSGFFIETDFASSIDKEKDRTKLGIPQPQIDSTDCTVLRRKPGKTQ